MMGSASTDPVEHVKAVVHDQRSWRRVHLMVIGSGLTMWRRRRADEAYTYRMPELTSRVLVRHSRKCQDTERARMSRPD